SRHRPYETAQQVTSRSVTSLKRPAHEPTSSRPSDERRLFSSGGVGSPAFCVPRLLAFDTAWRATSLGRTRTRQQHILHDALYATDCLISVMRTRPEEPTAGTIRHALDRLRY